VPELPEVQTAVHYLSERLIGSKVEEVFAPWPRTLASHSAEEANRLIGGRRFKSVSRRGKYIIAELAEKGRPPLFLIGHLRMTGCVDVVSRTAPNGRHERFILRLDRNREFRFNDPRKFGRWHITNSAEEFLQVLGPEPLDTAFTVERFLSRLNTRRGAIKPTLLDQSFVAGLGNIYVDESLWSARVHPLLPCHLLTPTDAARLLKAIKSILQSALDALGTDFGDGVVKDGMYKTRVYGRQGAPCKRCGTEILRLVVGQRGTHVCPTCQIAPRSRRRRPH
jgi:formamidopyrimidine-DNA glycosylase